MVKKGEASSQHTKEDSDPKTQTIAAQRRSYETNSKAQRRKKVSIFESQQTTHSQKPEDAKSNFPIVIQNRKQKQEAKREKAIQELEKLKAEVLAPAAKGVEIPAEQDSPEETKAVEFEYTNANEMEELGSSNAFAEFMTIFQRFDEQVAIKMDQAKIDTSMEALLPTVTQPKEAEKADATD